MAASQQSGTITVREIEGAPQPDTSSYAELSCFESVATLRVPGAISSGGGMIEAKFQFVSTLIFGGPNDEGLPGHRLWGTGLKYYAVHEVFGSDLIADLERRASKHPRYRPGTYHKCRHIIITMKEETFECVCRTIELTLIPDRQAS